MAEDREPTDPSPEDREPTDPPPEDPQLEVVRLAVSSEATKSVKRTLLACMIIRAARLRTSASTGLGRRAVTVVAIAASAEVAHWWHLIMLVLGHIAR